MPDAGLEALFEAIRMEAAYHVFFAGTWSEKTKSWRYYPREDFPAWYVATLSD